MDSFRKSFNPKIRPILTDAYLIVPSVKTTSYIYPVQIAEKTNSFLVLFGISVAPLVFTKLMKSKKVFKTTVYSFSGLLWRYLDNKAIKIESQLEAPLTVKCLQSIGFLINRKKSVFGSSYLFPFLGFQVNSVDMSPSQSQKHKHTKIVQESKNQWTHYQNY